MTWLLAALHRGPRLEFVATELPGRTRFLHGGECCEALARRNEGSAGRIVAVVGKS